MDIVKQEKGGPTVDYYPEGHHFEGQLIFYPEWLTLNPYRKLTDISRWHAIHESLIQTFMENKQSVKDEKRLAWEQANPDKVVARKKEDKTPFTGDLTGALSQAIDNMVNPERASPVGEFDISTDLNPYPEDEPILHPEEESDELS